MSENPGERLQDIVENMSTMLAEAEQIIKRHCPRHLYDRMKSYCIPAVAMALSEEHDYLGSGGATFSEAVDYLLADECEEEEDEDDDDSQED